jgi:hypothetical protein
VERYNVKYKPAAQKENQNTANGQGEISLNPNANNANINGGSGASGGVNNVAIHGNNMKKI